jgi:Flp pilus assembly protein TadG
MVLRLRDLARDCAGAVLVEFAVMLPVLLLLVLVLVLVLPLAQFGLIFYDYIMATSAAATGARQLSISVHDTNAYTDTVNAIIASTSLNPALSSSNITLTVNGTACTTNATCSSALQTAFNAAATPPQAASVTVSFTCTIFMPTSLLNITGICPPTSTMKAAVVMTKARSA